MREAVSLVGGYGITEDCPGFLGHKWMDAQLEATYEGPEAVQRRQLSVTMTNEVFLASFRSWIATCAASPRRNPDRRLHAGHRDGALALDARAPAKEHRRLGAKLYSSNRQGVSSRWPTRCAGCSPRAPDPRRARTRDERPGQRHRRRRARRLVNFFSDLCAVQAPAPPANPPASAPSSFTATIARMRARRCSTAWRVVRASSGVWRHQSTSLVDGRARDVAAGVGTAVVDQHRLRLSGNCTQPLAKVTLDTSPKPSPP
jgi:hypothetical protein